MKRSILIIIAILISAIMFSNDDRPKAQKEELLKVIQNAEQKQRPYELLEACLKYRQVVRSVNWKESKESAEFIDKTLRDYVSEHEGAAYPIDAYLDYVSIKYDAGRTAALKAYMQKYQGKAVALQVEADLLESQFYSMEIWASSDDYLKFRSTLQEFEKRRASFKGWEAEVAKNCVLVKQLLKQMDSKVIRFTVSNDRLINICLRNLSSVTVDIKAEGKDEILWEQKLDNHEKSYCKYDTLTVGLPELNDGTYILRCKAYGVEAKSSYQQSSISLAYRKEARGCAIYAADYMSGKPVEKADLTIYDNKSGEKTVYEGFVFDSFSLLPEKVARQFTQRKELFVSYTDEKGFYRCSKNISLAASDFSGEKKERSKSRTARIYTDRGAYNPGDTVQFKALLYETSAEGQMRILDAGTKAEVKLYDVQGKEISVKRLLVNDFGSVFSLFVLPSKTDRNGRFSLALFCDGQQITRKYIVVDEFILPSYFIDFEENEEVCFPGDTIVVRGRVEAYSGHSLSGADISYIIRAGDFMQHTEMQFSQEGKLKLSPDGKFEFEFAIPKENHALYTISVRVVPQTGETQERTAYQLVTTGMDVNMDVLAGEALGRAELDTGEYEPNKRKSVSVLESDEARIRIYASNFSNFVVPTELDYTLASVSGEVLDKGKIASGDSLDIKLNGRESGLYILTASTSYRNYKDESVNISHVKRLVLADENDTAIDCPELEIMFREFGTEQIKLQLATTIAPLWAVAELSDTKGNILESEVVYLSGVNGKDGSLKTIDYEYLESYDNKLTLTVFYFRSGNQMTYRKNCYRPQKKYELPLEFTRFTDKTTPRAEVSFQLKTAADVETLVSVYDKSTARLEDNSWDKIYRPYQESLYNHIRAYNGSTYSYGFTTSIDGKNKNGEETVPFSLAESKPVFVGYGTPKKSARTGAANSYPDEAVAVRNDFRNTLAFLPALRSDEDGMIDFDVRAADKLSTYYVQVFAHDRQVNTAVLCKEMLVNLPMQLAVSPPSVLYAGDIYKLRVSLSNTAPYILDGRLYLQLYDNKDYESSEPIRSEFQKLSVPAAGETVAEFGLEVPEGVDTLGFKVVYLVGSKGNNTSDAVFVTVPVKAAEQSLAESHSALLLPGADVELVKKELASRFTGVSGADAEYREMSLMDLLLQSLPDKALDSADDVLSRSGAYYINRMRDYILASAGKDSAGKSAAYGLSEIFACQNADGGFAWFEGFKSSPVLTAVVLERFAMLRSRGLLPGEKSCSDKLAKAVHYIDNQRINSTVMPMWYGGLSLEQYLYVRVQYPDVVFAPECDTKTLDIYKDDIKAYLFDKPSSGLGILSKARRASILLALASSSHHPELGSVSARSAFNPRKAKKAAEKAMDSLMEYAVEHPSGGVYYPNAVMPYRGLLENEAYAHSMICNLMRSYGSRESLRIADGISLWLMVQKETQAWEQTPYYLNAVTSVVEASRQVKDAKIAVMSRSYTKAFDEIKAAGNGFTLERRFYRIFSDNDDEKEEIREGDTLAVGDKIVAEYRIWSQENRSFVKLTAPRYACMRAVNQLSATLINRVRFYSKRVSITPYIYREVKADLTNWYMDVCPEEEMSFSEEFFVTLAGRFTAPVVTVESSYAPHYRANTAFSGYLLSQ